MDRVLLVSNPRARSVSARGRQVIAKALAADFKLEVADTTARNHASELAQDAVTDGYDAVVAFGGDGTVNETAQGIVGSDTCLGIIPGGMTNVFARAVGMPTDPIDATAFVASHIRSRTTRRINVGRIADRYFLFCAGMGLDAEVVRRTEARPESKTRWGKWVFLKNALRAAATEYRGADPTISFAVEGGDPEDVVTAVFANARPFTYFGPFPVDVCPQARLDDAVDAIAVRKVRLGTIPRIAWAVMVSRGHIRWRIIGHHHDITRVALASDRPHPVQVDGDYIGEHSHATVEHVPDALDLLV